MKKFKFLGVILARSGSKGIRGKNIKDVCGHPLLAYSIYAGLKSKYLNKLVVSTDSRKIARIAKNYGASTPFLRPKKLAGDQVWSRDALKHAVLESEKIFQEKYDFIIELPAVAPLRPSHQIDKAIEKLVKTKSDSVIGVTRVYDKHPLRIKKIKNDKLYDFNNSLKEGESSRRQALAPCYVRNGSIYAMKRETIINNFSRKGKISRPLIMDEKYSVNIDEKSDLYLVETFIKKGLCENFPASIYNERKVRIFKKNLKNNFMLVSYPYEISSQIFNQFLGSYNLVYCNVNNLHNINKKIKEKIKIWITDTTGSVKIGPKQIRNFKYIDIVASPSTGITHIDDGYLKKENIKLIYLNNSKIIKNINSSSEYALALVMVTLRNIYKGILKVKEGNWRNKERELRAHELENLKFGIFGLGRIGSKLHKNLKNMTSKISYYDPYVKIKNNIIKRETKITKFLKNINFLIISSSYNKKMHNYFDFKKLKMLPKNSSIVNVSRGEILNEKALMRLIKSKHLNNVSLDVICNENRILSHKNSLINFSRQNNNLLITPHIAGLTYESERKALEKIFDLLKKIL